MHKLKFKTIDGHEFSSTVWYCDKCKQEIPFDQMVSVRIEDFSKRASPVVTRQDYHASCMPKII